jgi:hypothetical protein
MSRRGMPAPSPGDPYGLVELRARTHRSLIRWIVSFGILESLVSIPVATANGTPTALAVALGVLLALVQLVVVVRPDPRWGLWVGGACALAMFWPTFALVGWAAVAGLYAVLFVLLTVNVLGERRKDRAA